MRYRRANVEGRTYFFTANLAERHLRLLVENVDGFGMRLGQSSKGILFILMPL